MPFLDLLAAALVDPFRIGLIVALVLTTLRTQAATGRWLPLAAGVLFVAVIIPATMGTAQPIRVAVAIGVVANLLLLAAALAARALVLAWRG